jgi:lysophospholipase L1-like esterase
VPADVYNRWTDLLAARFAGLPADESKAVVNAGISGNTVVSGGAGYPALLRMNNDVLVREGVTHLIFFAGTNDIGNGATAMTVIAGDQQIINRAHTAGLKIIGATIMPRGAEKAWTENMEEQRLALNEWIRHGANFDGVIDFDELMRGPLNPTNRAVTMPVQWSCADKDGVHPNADGYAAMSSFIDLRLFSADKER